MAQLFDGEIRKRKHKIRSAFVDNQPKIRGWFVHDISKSKRGGLQFSVCFKTKQAAQDFVIEWNAIEEKHRLTQERLLKKFRKRKQTIESVGEPYV